MLTMHEKQQVRRDDMKHREKAIPASAGIIEWE